MLTTKRARYRARLPQLHDRRLFLTDSGLETTLVFHDRIDLPCFAAFPLMETVSGLTRLRDYYVGHARIAVARKMGFVLEAPTWRANPDWGAKLGYSLEALADVDRCAIDLMVEVRDMHAGHALPMVISGNIGPRGDGYKALDTMSAREAQDYHGRQVENFAATEADMVAAFTLTYPEEAIGVVRAAAANGMPVAISFTVETDGRLPSGDELGDAIARVDEATDSGPAYYMINCAHPTHFEPALARRERWLSRVAGVRANASRRSHAELDESSDLDDGDPAALGREMAALRRVLPRLSVLGGCCGTDHRHVEEIGFACREAA